MKRNPRSGSWLGRGQLAGVVLILAVGFGSSALAEDERFESMSDEMAELMLRLLTAAEEAENDGRFDEAVDLYVELWNIEPLDQFRFRQAHCLEQLGQFTNALEVYTELATSTQSDVARNAAARANVLAELLNNLPARLRFMTDQLGASVTIDEESRGVIREGGFEVEVEPGQHRIVIELEGYEPVEHEITVNAGEARDLQVSLERISNPQSEEQTGVSALVPILVGTAAVAVAGTGLAFGLLSNSRAEEEREYDMETPGATVAEMQGLASEAEDFATYANIAFGVAGALAVAAIVTFFFVDGSEGDSSETVFLVPHIQHGAVGAGLGMRF